MSKTTFIKSVFILCLMALPLGVSAQSLKGDVNDDGLLGITDVNLLIDYLLTNDSTGINLANADADGDGEVSIGDVAGLIDTLLAMSSGSQDDHERVDLGLPSGTLWATCNVGASAPEDYGDYFAWGETEPKSYYDWSTYMWCEGDGTSLTKYCDNTNFILNGSVDNKTELDLEDDAAYVNWGSSWRMPSLEQIQELCDNCTGLWTQRNGVNGLLVTGPNGNTLFLPAAGYRWSESLSRASSYGSYWSRTLTSYDFDNGDYAPWNAWLLCFDSRGLARWGDNPRYAGLPVRAVRIP